MGLPFPPKKKSKGYDQKCVPSEGERTVMEESDKNKQDDGTVIREKWLVIVEPVKSTNGKRRTDTLW